MKYPVYPEMKDSGVEWLGEIPEHWETSKLKYTTFVNMGQSPSSVYYNDNGIGYPFLQGNAEFKEKNPMPKVFCKHSNKYANKDDILISVRAPVGEINIADQKYGIGRGLCALSVKNINNIFLWYTLQVLRKELFSLSTGSTYDSVTTEDIKNMSFIIPSLIEQKAIANFLDKETGRIDKLIDKKEQLIELLQEKRQALISHAVTKGLDRDVQMKDSGISWLGEIPMQWEVKKLKYMGKVIGGYAFDSNDFISEGVKVIKIQNIQHMNLDWSEQSYLPENFYKEHKKYSVSDGSVVFALTRPIISTGIKAAMVKTNGEKVLLNQRTAVFKPNYNIKSDYLYYLVSSYVFTQPFSLKISTTNQPNISTEDIENIKFSFPPKKEQKQIVKFLDKGINKIDKLIEKVNKQISNLKEYRKALISNAVTGKIDVREIYQNEGYKDI